MRKAIYTVDASFEIHIPAGERQEAHVEDVIDAIAHYCNTLANDGEENIYLSTDGPVFKAAYDEGDDR